MKEKKIGIITGCDQNQEWMLPSWWEHYQKTNTLPVTFIDFGMTKSARLWCEKKGTVIDVPIQTSFVKPKESICPIQAKFWERVCGDHLWHARPIWFIKPFALQKSPYEQSLWIDLDTRIKKDLSPLFSTIDSNFAIAPTSDRYKKFANIIGLHLPNEQTYNAGVILFHRDSPTLHKWAKYIPSRNGEFLGDETLLDRIIYEENLPITHLSRNYNWPYFEGDNPDAAIIHFLGPGGKKQLQLL